MEIGYKLPQKSERLGRDARRSNRPITHFACDLIDRFMDGLLEPGVYECHNTKVECSGNSKERSLSVFLYETNLMTLSLDHKGEPTGLSLSVGNRFARESGFPASAVIERMNGILDTIGYHSIIPVGVRLFKDVQANTYVIGRGDDPTVQKIAIGKNKAQDLVVDPDPEDFVVLAHGPN